MTASLTRAISPWLCLPASLLTLLPAATVRGQTNEAIAESLFVEGRELYAEQHYAEACQKLDQSHRADPAGGTVLLLAMCYEQLGRTASAWARYSEALALARRDGRADREQKAQEAMTALATQLAHVRLSLEPEAQVLPNLQFVLDDVEIPLLVDAKVPVDPGEHVLVVRSKEHEPWTHTFSVTEPGGEIAVTVPGLKPLVQQVIAPVPVPLAPLAPPPASPPPPLEPKSNSARTVAFVVGGAGLVAVGVGSYYAWHAKHLDNLADERCPATQCDDSKAVAWSRDATSEARAATWLVGVGGAAVATAGALWFFSSRSSAGVSASAFVLPSGGALAVAGRY